MAAGCGLLLVVLASPADAHTNRSDFDGSLGYSYEVYTPTVTQSVVVNGQTSDLRYNHDCSDVLFGTEWITVWNGNQNRDEAKPGQLNYMATSSDRVN